MLLPVPPLPLPLPPLTAIAASMGVLHGITVGLVLGAAVAGVISQQRSKP